MYKTNALLDIGVVQSVVLESKFQKVTSKKNLVDLVDVEKWSTGNDIPEFKIRIGNGSLVNVLKQVNLRFPLKGSDDKETFPILATMGIKLKETSLFET